jgi:Ca2+-transporting ATPase
MGRRGSDVAREAAALVLLDDDFSSLVRAIAQGRTIFDNIRNALGYIVAVHVPTAGMALLPLVFGWPLVLFPAHVVFLELVIDPACSIAFESEPAEENAMRRPPRPARSRLFDAALLVTSLVHGCVLLAAIALLYGFEIAAGTPEGQARATAFAAIVLGNVALIFSSRSRDAALARTLMRPNRALWAVAGFAVAGLAATLYIPPVSGLFRFVTPDGAQLAAAAAAASVGLVLAELYKWLHFRRSARRQRRNGPLRQINPPKRPPA